MKKRVRIYKSSDGEGKFINKTAQFLQRAQEGGVPDSSMMGYPGAQQQSQELTDDQLASVVLQDISNSAPREAIVVKLVNVFGKEPMEAMQFVDQMYNYVEQQQQSEIDSEDNEDEESEDIVSGNDVMEVAQPIEEEESQSGTDMSNEMILEDDGSDYDDNEAAADLIMKYGGYYRAQEGMEVPIEMPDVSAYLPENMFDAYGNPNYYGDTNAAADIAWAPPQMDGTDEQEDINAFSGFETPEIPEEIIDEYAKYGGSKQSKKQFVSSVLKLVKKQMGGDNQDPKSADFTDDHADPTGSGVRKKNLNKFIGSIKNESSIAAAKKQAEQKYDQMMQQQQMSQQYPVAQNGGEQDIYQGQDYENPMHHLAAYSQAAGDVFNQDQNQMIQARNGGVIEGCFPTQLPNGQIITNCFPSQEQRNENQKQWEKEQAEWKNREQQESSYEQPNRNVPSGYPNIYGSGYNRGTYGGGYRMPAGLQGMPPITKIDVRKSGWLTGRPRQYSIEFGQGSPMPGMGMPGQGAGFYGYGARTVRWPATRRSVVTDATSVNKEALKEVAKETPGSTATTNAANPETVTTVSTTTQGTVASTVKPGGTTQTQTKTVNGKTETNPVNSKTVQPTDKSDTKEKKTLTDGVYTYPGKNNLYKKKEGVWYIDTTGTGKKYQQLKSGDVTGRINALESKATLYKKSAANTTQKVNPAAYSLGDPMAFTNALLSKDQNQVNKIMFPGYQEGGNTSQDMMGDNGELLKYVYGGDEYDDISQGDIDDVYSKDTANGDFPMAQFGRSIGRAIRNYFPANVMPVGQYTRMQRGPYNTQTGQAQNFIPGTGTYLKNIDVKKSSWITGRPKKYTITYGNQEMDPRKQNIITLPGSGAQTSQTQGDNRTANNNQRSDIKGLKLGSKAAVRKGELGNKINDWKLKMLGLDEYGNKIGSEQSDKVPMSNVEMLTKQGKIWDEKSKRWIVKPEPLSAPMQYMKDSLTVPNNPQPFSSDQLINTSGPRNTEMQYGGDLRRFMPYVQSGAETPVTYTSNPALAGMTDVDMISLNPGISGINKSSFWNDQASFNPPAPERDKSKDPVEYKVDPNQGQSHQAENVYSGTEGDTSMDFKTKNLYDNDAYLNVANAGIRGVTGMINRAQNRKSEAKMYENYNADNLYAAKTVKDQGDYDPNTGLYRPSNQGAKNTSRSKQYGGDVYQDGGYVEGDEVYMTDDEIQEFLANGGDLEFI